LRDRPNRFEGHVVAIYVAEMAGAPVRVLELVRVVKASGSKLTATRANDAP
jgi:hypothetical protein